MQPWLEVEALCEISGGCWRPQFLYLAPRTRLTTGPSRAGMGYFPGRPSPAEGAQVGPRLDSSQVPHFTAATSQTSVSFCPSRIIN